MSLLVSLFANRQHATRSNISQIFLLFPRPPPFFFVPYGVCVPTERGEGSRREVRYEQGCRRGGIKPPLERPKVFFFSVPTGLNNNPPRRRARLRSGPAGRVKSDFFCFPLSKNDLIGKVSQCRDLPTGRSRHCAVANRVPGELKPG